MGAGGLGPRIFNFWLWPWRLYNSVRLGELITSREWQKAPFPRHRARREEEGRQLEEEAVRHFSYLLLLICVGDEGRRLAAECGLDRRHGGRHAARAWRMSSSSSCGWHRPRLRRVRMPLRRAAVEVCARLSCKQTFALTMPTACRQHSPFRAYEPTSAQYSSSLG